ncbi:FadR/GntR family transcriptional regulator [Prosthecomicrobium sp. N25]|uniref:FadR/GntR family transcriptional regulator n=1 Tax=Prosthecomicrobium sp. N25 TaxID=3129254 RepID=UPI00307828C5
MQKQPSSGPLALGTFPRSKNLVGMLSEHLEREIREGRLVPGDRLPTEAALAASAGVSRTVVREAVASLKASGLVETRQGAGAFVRQPPPGFGPVPGIERATVDDIVWILELRLAVEVEAAALAASRRKPADIEALDGALAEMARAHAVGQDGVAADLAFHRALAAATGNPYFGRFLDQLGELALPRRRLTPHKTFGPDYLDLVEREHRAIRDAVVAGDAALAAAAMRGHLAGSRARYAGLA